MKKLFLGSISLLTFSIAILVFQISCQKEVEAQTGSAYILPKATTSALGGIIVGNGLSITSEGVLSASVAPAAQLGKIVYRKRDGTGAVDEIWTANYDGSGQTKINITLPAGLTFGESMRPFLSPDGTKVFFTCSTQVSNEEIYSVNIDGTDLKKIIDRGSSGALNIGGAY